VWAKAIVGSGFKRTRHIDQFIVYAEYQNFTVRITIDQSSDALKTAYAQHR
jgi:hypothetical protein